MNHLKIKLDDKIAENEFILRLFKNIHPNIITLFGFYLNFQIMYYVKTNQYLKANYCLLFRCLADIFDGAVARKYNKTSKLGGLLDTLSDLTILLFYINLFSLLITKNKLLSKKIMIVSFIIIMFIYNKNNSFIWHSNIKNNHSSLIDSYISFFSNNSIFLYLIFAIINYYKYKIKYSNN